MIRIPCGNGWITWQILADTLNVAVVGVYYCAADGEEQITAHPIGKLVHVVGALGYRILSLDLSRAEIPDEGRQEIKAFVNALRAKRWRVAVQYPARRTRIAPKSKLRLSLRSAIGSIGRTEHVVIRVLVLASLLLNGTQLLMFESGFASGGHVQHVTVPTPDSPRDAAHTEATDQSLASPKHNGLQTFLRVGDISESVFSKLTADALEMRTTPQQIALSALQWYAARSRGVAIRKKTPPNYANR